MFSKIKIVHINKTKSTQDSVVDYLKNDYYSSLLLISKTQTKGRGRKQNDWYSPEGGFWATLGISTRFSFTESQLALFHYCTATLLSRIIFEEYKLRVQIKWPNDILFENKKLAGILIEYIIGSDVNYLLIGMGVNLNNSGEEIQKKLNSTAISVKDILHKSVSINFFAHKICFYANEYYSPVAENNLKEIENLIQEYNRNSQIFNKNVILDDLEIYHCQGINLEGLMQFVGKNVKLNLRIDDNMRIKEIIS